MKYGLLIDFGWKNCNYGDYAQSIAIEHIYSLMNISREEICYLSREQLKDYDGEQLLLPFSYVLSYLMDRKSEKAALSDKITPVFLSVSIGVGFTRPIDVFTDSDNGWMELFWKNAPIGCRDEATRKFFETLGIPAYLQGCITNVLPRRLEQKNDKVLLVDCPIELLDYIPRELLQKAEVLGNSEHIGGLSLEENYQKIKRRYQYYQENASLVVTTRYHVATPCNAMGIPSILLMRPFGGKSKDIRLDSLHPEISLYAEDAYEHINWYPRQPQSDLLRNRITQLAVARLRAAEAVQAEAEDIRAYFSDRISAYETLRPSDRFLIKRLREFVEKNFRACKNGHFYIWAASVLLCDGDRVPLAELVQKVNPGLEFAGWIDTYKEGVLAGRPIIKPTELRLGDEDFIIVATGTVISDALDFFRFFSIGPEQYVLYFDKMLTQDDLDAARRRQL